MKLYAHTHIYSPLTCSCRSKVDTRHLTWPANILQGLPRSSETLRFAEELLARTPRAGAAPNDYRERERQAAAVVRLHGPKHCLVYR